MAQPVYADTSFLVSLYVQDANSAKAVARVGKLLPLVLTPLLQHELRNALRLCVFRRQITTAQREQALRDLEQDIEDGVLHEMPLDWAKAFQYAEILGRDHTEKTGGRGMDILHVASAQALQVKRFITFDDRQRELAKQVGFAVS